MAVRSTTARKIEKDNKTDCTKKKDLLWSGKPGSITAHLRPKLQNSSIIMIFPAISGGDDENNVDDLNEDESDDDDGGGGGGGGSGSYADQNGLGGDNDGLYDGFRHRVDLTEGDAVIVDRKLLMEKLQAYPRETKSLPMEAAFDIRGPDNSLLMIHIGKVQIAPAFAWTCSPNELLAENPRAQCLSDNPIMFSTKVVKKKKYHGKWKNYDKQLNKLIIEDPSSVIDGRRTQFEIYFHRSISQYAPPCPRIRRFCDNTFGIPNVKNNEESERDVFLRSSRAVIRIIIASPIQKPVTFEPRTARSVQKPTVMDPNDTTSVRIQRQTSGGELEQVPKFEFQVTALKRRGLDSENPCDEGWTTCDSEVCIPKKYWCDNIINCPQWQDEGQCEVVQPNPDAIGPDGIRIGDIGKSPSEIRKEQEAREAAAEALAAQQLHMSILGGLGLMMFLVVATCVSLTIRRRRRDRRRQIPKDKVVPVPMPSASQQKPHRLNHVMSASELLKDGTLELSNHQSRLPFTMPKSSSTQDDNRPSDQNVPLASRTNTGWNSTDSMDAPLLAVQHKSGKQSNHVPRKQNSLPLAKRSQVVPNNIALRDIPRTLRKEEPVRGSSPPEGSPWTNQRLPYKYSSKDVQKSAIPTAVCVSGDQNLSITVSSSSRGGPMPTKIPANMIGRVPVTGYSNVSVVPYTSDMSPVVQKSPVTSRGNQYGENVPMQMKAAQPLRRITTKPGVFQLNSPRQQATQWLPGPAPSTQLPTPIQPVIVGTTDSQNLRSPADKPVTEQTYRPARDLRKQMSQQQPQEGHFYNCRLINRAQSWGVGLRLAGVDPFCNGEWEVTRSNDSADADNSSSTVERDVSDDEAVKRFGGYDLGLGRAEVFCRCERYKTSEFMSTLLDRRPSASVSMPDVNGAVIRSTQIPQVMLTIEQNEGNSQRLQVPLLARECKPPSAKRPRMIDQIRTSVDRAQWVPTSYGTEANEAASIHLGGQGQGMVNRGIYRYQPSRDVLLAQKEANARLAQKLYVPGSIQAYHTAMRPDQDDSTEAPSGSSSMIMSAANSNGGTSDQADSEQYNVSHESQMGYNSGSDATSQLMFERRSLERGEAPSAIIQNPQMDSRLPRNPLMASNQSGILSRTGPQLVPDVTVYSQPIRGGELIPRSSNRPAQPQTKQKPLTESFIYEYEA
ncbi:unnamed protein product [Calicophoron daubneyi]|uniref:CUB domain-containing protein n=1 Tax=Calicophoron daubneyi TaxID=300641 RepID=A0AAV2TER4_CALDB